MTNVSGLGSEHQNKKKNAMEDVPENVSFLAVGLPVFFWDILFNSTTFRIWAMKCISLYGNMFQEIRQLRF